TVAVGKKDTETEKIGAELKGLLKKSKAKETTTEEPKKQKTQKKSTIYLKMLFERNKGFL
ncbi:MAG: hypothetical protein N2Z60_07220, partial [Elusimicrobiales bacterium]|nr:hypothetical protein [Elusimicrobiales bacterium]